MKFGIREKIFGGFLILAILFLSVLLLAIRDINNMRKTFEFGTAYPLQITQDLGAIESMVISIHRSMKDVASSRSEVERGKYLLIVDNLEQSILKKIENLHQNIILAKEKTQILEFRTDLVKWRPIRQKVSILAKSGDPDLSLRITRKEGADYVEFLLRGVSKLRNIEMENYIVFAKKFSDQLDDSQSLIIFILILSITTCIFIALFLAISITRRISVLNMAVEKMVEGEFEHNIKVKGNDEISRLAKSFNLMGENLSISNKALKKNIKDRTKELKKVNEDFDLLRSELENEVVVRTIEIEDKLDKLNRSQKAMLFMIEDLNKISKMLTTAQGELLLKERLAVLGQFSGSISHELRNPLGVIDSSVFYLRKKLKNVDPKIEEHFNRIRSSIINASAIIESILNLIRMKTPELEENNLIDILSESIEISRVPAKVKITKKFPEKDIIILSENIQLKMAFKNIIKNAVESMKEKGDLKIGINQMKDGEV